MTTLFFRMIITSFILYICLSHSFFFYFSRIIRPTWTLCWPWKTGRSRQRCSIFLNLWTWRIKDTSTSSLSTTSSGWHDLISRCAAHSKTDHLCQCFRTVCVFVPQAIQEQMKLHSQEPVSFQDVKVNTPSLITSFLSTSLYFSLFSLLSPFRMRFLTWWSLKTPTRSHSRIWWTAARATPWSASWSTSTASGPTRTGRCWSPTKTTAATQLSSTSLKEQRLLRDFYLQQNFNVNKLSFFL